jgi:hypothetical protein
VRARRLLLPANHLSGRFQGGFSLIMGLFCAKFAFCPLQLWKQRATVWTRRLFCSVKKPSWLRGTAESDNSGASAQRSCDWCSWHIIRLDRRRLHRSMLFCVVICLPAFPHRSRMSCFSWPTRRFRSN